MSDPAQYSQRLRRARGGVIADCIQDSIREDRLTLEYLDGAPTGFPPCELAGVDYDELGALFAPLKTDRELRRRLVYRRSELSVVIFLLDNQRALAEDVLSCIPGAWFAGSLTRGLRCAWSGS